MKVIQNLVPQSKHSIKCPYPMVADCYVVHNTYNDAPAKNEIAYMLRNNNKVSYHYAIDDREIIQAIPENRNAWHAGDGNGQGNRKGIGIEICYSKSGGPRFIQAEKNAAEFIAKGLKEKGWGIDRVKKHQDFSGKYCPHRTLDMGWQRFLTMIQVELDNLNNDKVKVRFMGRDLLLDGTFKDDKNYVGIRDIVELLGYKVEWEQSTKTVVIK